MGCICKKAENPETNVEFEQPQLKPEAATEHIDSKDANANVYNIKNNNVNLILKSNLLGLKNDNPDKDVDSSRVEGSRIEGSRIGSKKLTKKKKKCK